MTKAEQLHSRRCVRYRLHGGGGLCGKPAVDILDERPICRWHKQKWVRARNNRAAREAEKVSHG